MIVKTVQIATDNAEGFYICDADKIPEGSKLFGAIKTVVKRTRKKKVE